MNRRVLNGLVSIGFLLLGVLVFMQMQGCGGHDATPVAGSTAALSVAITDSPAFRDFSSVHIKITKVLVVPAGKENAADDDEDLWKVQFPRGPGCEHSAASFPQQLLGTIQVPVGKL